MKGENEPSDRVTELVQSALALPPEDRDAYLRATCTVDAGLFEEVRNRVEEEARLRSPGNYSAVTGTESANPVFAPGELVSNRFRIVRELGRGGMGVVYEVTDEKLERRIAIKCARQGFQNRLTPEARAAIEISHPNVCKLYELHTAASPVGPVDFLTMEFVEGETLLQRLRRDGPLPVNEARDIALQICSGLAEVHRQGIIHGDLKSSNVILSRSSEGHLRAVLTDFGLAKLKGAPAHGSHVMSAHGGTLDYMAPELFTGSRASFASDIYALGVLWREMLTGEIPDRRKTAPIGDLPKPWNRAAAKCLEREPAHRFSSVAEAAASIEERRAVPPWIPAAAVALLIVLALFLWRTREAPVAPVRLAVLPVAIEGPAIPAAAGLAADVADRLSGARRNFTVIGPGEALRNQVDTSEKARRVLGATHVLRIRMRSSGSGGISASASLDDTGSGNSLRELKGIYSPGETKLLAKAVLATVDGAFRLRGGVPPETVSAVAYPSYVQGVERMRRDSLSGQEAIPFFEKAIQLDPQSALPYAGLADAQMQRFDQGAGRQWLDLAEASVAKARSINPDSAPVLLVSGYLHQENGRYEQAIADFIRATELDPSNSEAWRHLAVAYEKTNRAAEAIATYRKAIETQPGYYRHYVDFGNFYLYRGEFQQAERQYRQVTTIAPSLFSGHMNLGLALMQQGRLKEAEDSLLKALELRRTPRLLMNLGALYYRQERYGDAARWFEQSLAAGPPSAVRYRDLADAYRHLGHQADAQAAYRQAQTLAEDDIARDPRQAISRSLLAVACAALGDQHRASLEIAEALAMEQENTTVMQDAAIVYEGLGEREKILELLRRAPRSVVQNLAASPDVPQLRSDPRFQDMIPR